MKKHPSVMAAEALAEEKAKELAVERELVQQLEREHSEARVHNPPHPGLTLRDDVLPALGMNVTDAAEALGVTRPTLSRVLNGAAAVSPEMALRLERWLGVEHGGRADVWLGMQASYDLWTAEQKTKALIRKVKPLSVAVLAAV